MTYAEFNMIQGLVMHALNNGEMPENAFKFAKDIAFPPKPDKE